MAEWSNGEATVSGNVSKTPPPEARPLDSSSAALALTLCALSDMAERIVFSRDKIPNFCHDRSATFAFYESLAIDCHT